MLKDLIIFHKAYDFFKWSHLITAKFPKFEKFVLAQQIRNCCLLLIEFIIEANNSVEKSEEIFEIEVSLEKLRIFYRLAFELRYIGVKQYENTAKMLDEIGRLLGGWKKKFSPSAKKGTAI